MTTLDDQVPPGYFDDLPGRTLARLDDGSVRDEPADAILASSSSDAIPPAAAAEPPVTAPPAPAPIIAAATATAADEPAPAAPAPPREDDSGLHDLRSLASSQRMRMMSSKRSSQNPIKSDDELLASASSSWKSIALPAAGGSLPDPSEPPPAQEVEKAAAPRDSKQKLEAVAEVPPPARAEPVGKGAPRREAAAAVEPPAVIPISAAKAKPKAAAGKRGGARTALIAAAGVGLVAAAGMVIVVSTQSKSDNAAMRAEPASPRASTPLPEIRRVQPAPAVIAAPEAAGSAMAIEPKLDPPAADRGTKPAPAVEKPGKSTGKYVPEVVDDPAPPTKTKRDEPKKKPEPGDPDFDKLLKEAGYQEKKPEGPKLEKKSLSIDDIKKSMNGVSAQVAKCYDGQQGTAAVKLTVAPSGQIQTVAILGAFAGTKVGACVEAAVKAVVFSPWEGAPQSVNYSYLLAE